MLPPITTTLDDINITTDDASNTPPSSFYQCVGYTMDVKGPGYTSATDITWSILDNTNTPVTSGVTFTGQNTFQATVKLDTSVAAGNYTVKAVETGTPANVSTHAFTLLALPAITVGSPNQPHVGGHTQFLTTFPFPLTWSAPAEVNSTTGLATWASAGTKTVTYSVTGSSCTKTLSFVVYSNVAVAEYDNVNPIYVNSGGTQALTVSGGSGTYTYSISGQNSISPTGVITAGIYPGEYMVTVVDATANVIRTIPVAVGAQSQFCVAIESTSCDTQEQADACCELSVNCGESITLKVPSFHLRINGRQEEVTYSSYGTGTIGEHGYLKSGSASTVGIANKISSIKDEALFEIITNLDMADTVNAPFGVGFSKRYDTPNTSGIDIAVVWYTAAGVRKIEVRKNGVALTGSTFNILQGDAVSAGFKSGKFVVYINNLLQFETTDYDTCGDQVLHVAIEQPNKSIGGSITGLTWTVVTPGNLTEVGSIDANGIYASPTDTSFSLVEAQATAGNATFRIKIRNIKPTERITKPDAFLAGKAVTLWVGPYLPNMNETVRLAKDGSPDAIQNPGMIDCGTLEGSANFQEQFDYQDFENDLGQIYHTALIKESAQITGTFLEVRDLYKMATLKPEGVLHAKKGGVVEFSVGGKSCDLKELRVIMVIGQPGCDGVYDVLYLPRVQNKGNLGLEVGKKATGKYELTLTALPDYTRPAGKQLYSIYQIDNCSSETCS